MAWYNPHPYLITEYLLIEQNIAINDELLSWSQLPESMQPIHLQAYQNDYLDNDYDYLFSLRQEKYPLSNLVFDMDVTEIVCCNQKGTATSIRKTLCGLMNDWWQSHPERHSPKAQLESRTISDNNSPEEQL